MKKLISVLLALTFVLSMGIMSFAADETTTAAATTTTKASAEDQLKAGIDKIKAYFEGEDFEKIVTDLKEAVARVAGDPEEMAKMADEAVAKISAATGMNVEDVQKAIADSGLFDGFAKLYMPALPVTTTAAPTTTIVDTGSAAGGLAIFATLSVAAAAAFVCTKKK